ncbi:MAG: AMP-binding protein [Anaerolineae bacterium]|nr:AMP-binding protein [Anaerolineae bacterium]
MPKGFTQPDWLLTTAHDAPGLPALLQGDNAWTYADLSAYAGMMADSLALAGVERGDRVGVLLPNCFEYAALVWGIWRRGATVVPLNLRLTAGEVADQVRRAACKVVLADASLPADYFTSQPAKAYTIEPPDRNTERIDFIDMGSLPVADPHPNADDPSPEFTRLDVAVILFTSGTSGQPKGAQLTFNNFYYAAMASTLRIGNPPGDRWLLTLPLYHVGGLSMLVRACLCRVPVIVMDHFTPDALIAAATQHHATLISLVPTMLYRILGAQYSVLSAQSTENTDDSAEQRPAHPELSAQNSELQSEYRVSSTQYPIPSTEHRAPSTPHPEPRTQHPVPSTQHPVPSTEYPIPSTKHRAPSTPHPEPRTQHPVPSTEYPIPSTEHRALSTPFPPSVRLILLGGAAASADLLADAHARGLPVATTYGLTEAASQVCTALPDQARAKPGTVGRPLPFMRVRIVDSEGKGVPPGEVGEIVVQGLNVMLGYLGDPAPDIPLSKWGTPERLPYQDGFHTGDLGYLDADGDLFVVSRRSDLIVTGGENVYPAEVETVLRAHPAVAEVCVVGLPSAEWGQQVAALIVTTSPPGPLSVNREGEHETLIKTLDAFARERLAGYKVPRTWRFVEALPLTSNGKVDRAVAVRLAAD